MKIEIKKINGYWLINNKPYKKCNYFEQNFFNEFIKNIKNES